MHELLCRFVGCPELVCFYRLFQGRKDNKVGIDLFSFLRKILDKAGR